MRRTRALDLRPGPHWGSDMGCLVSRAQLDRVTAHVEDAVAQGARVLTGGRPRPDLGPLVHEPTVLEGVRPGMDCFAEETFGPVVALYLFAGEEEAVALANDGDYGLNASVYSRDTRRAGRLARELRCGTVNVNEAFAATFSSVDAPMGGMRASGLGRRQGPEGLLRFTEPQSVAVQRLVRFGPVGGLGDERFARLVTAQARLLHRLGRA